MTIDQLRAAFAIPGQLDFVAGEGGIVFAEITTAHATARISTYAGQVLSFKPNNSEQDVLFVSKQAFYTEGKAIKGGVPVCWPWFGPDHKDLGRPGHGYVRNRQWQVTDSEALGNGGVRLVLSPDLTDVDETLRDDKLSLSIQIDVGQSLEIRLITVNEDDHEVALSQALHTYFKVADISQAQVLRLAGCSYVDKMDGGAIKQQAGDVVITEEVDRIYNNVPPELIIEDDVLGRSIVIRSIGSNSAVVWNPWEKTASNMADLGDDEYQAMLCVETANAGADVIMLAPGQEHVLAVNMHIE